ncbi:hypothetical protein BDZ89DRAFT_1131178 [Hymenopellis radicata]|nr:hypothetical protein BDZ89DRAFT_1131178 [Hymenopellis radicata]
MPVLSSRYRPRISASSPYDRPTTSSSSSGSSKTSPNRILFLAQRALSIFLEVPENRCLLVNTGDYATIAALLNARAPLNASGRNSAPCAQRQTDLAKTLAALPFRSNVVHMVADVEDRFIGVPDALVKIWHAYVSQHGYLHEDGVFPANALDAKVADTRSYRKARSKIKSNPATFNPIPHITPPRIPPIPSSEEHTIIARPQRMNAPPAVWTDGPSFKSFVEYEPEPQLPAASLYDDKVRAIHFPSTSTRLVEEGDLPSVVRAVEDEIEEREIGELADMLVNNRDPVDDEEFGEWVEVAMLVEDH